jgi:hypothetical protein
MQEQAGRHVEQRGRDLHRQVRLAEDVGRGPDQPGDHRRLGIIAELEFLRPDPVLRLVRIEIDRLTREPQQAQERDDADRQQGDAEHRIDLAAKTGRGFEHGGDRRGGRGRFSGSHGAATLPESPDGTPAGRKVAGRLSCRG